jgi:hypothetical protein
MATARAEDFKEVVAYFSTTSLIPNPMPTSMVGIAKKIHEATYSLILWKFRLTLPSHAGPFLNEIASDALQILPQVLLGYTRPTKLLLRGIIENTLRLVYYTDHPVEFALTNAQAKWYIGVDKLFDYLKSHPNHKLAERSFDAINRLQTLYDLLSAGIHGRTVRDLESRSELSRITFSLSSATKEAALVKKCAEAVNFILAVDNKPAVRRFSVEDKGYIFGTMPRSARTAWHDFQGVLDRV